MPGIQIIGGGNNRTTKVSSSGKLETISSIFDVAATENIENELSFTLTNTITPSADSFFLYMKNESENPLIIVASEFWCAADETIKIYRNPVGEPTGANSISAENCNFGSSKISPSNLLYGQQINNISSDNLRNIIRLQANVSRRYTFDDWTILTRNSTIGFYVENGLSELDFWIQFFHLSERF